MGAMEQVGEEGYETDSSCDKVDGVLVNTMHRAASVDDLFAPLWGLNVHANTDSPLSSSTAAGPSEPSPLKENSSSAPGSSSARAAPVSQMAASAATPVNKFDGGGSGPGRSYMSLNLERQEFTVGPSKSTLLAGHDSISSSATESQKFARVSKLHSFKEGSQKNGSEGTSELIGGGRRSTSSYSSPFFSEIDGADMKPPLVPELESFPANTLIAKEGLAPGKSNSVGGADPTLPPSQSTSDDDQQIGGLDERKQKRMLSNRESARRSRLRKQQHLDELRAQVAHLRTGNSDMQAKYGIASQRYSQLTGENLVLRRHASDLSQKLQQLHHTLATQHPGRLHALGIQAGHLDSLPTGRFSSGHLSPYTQPLVPDLLH